MKNRELLLFLTPTDLTTMIEDFEMNDIVYYRTGMLTSNFTPKISSLLTQDNLGKLSIGDWNHSPSYLIANPKTKIVNREVKLRKGGSSFFIDQALNPDTIFFKPSGIFDDNVLIAGALSTISETTNSINLFKLFSKIVKQHTRKIGAFYVGLDAFDKLNQNWRLVTNVSSPAKYDLAIE